MKRKFLAAAFLLLLIFALSRLDAHSLRDSLGQIPAWAVLLLLALQIATQIAINLQWYAIARIVRLRITFGEILHANCKGAVMDAITPGVKIGGEVIRAVEIKRAAACDGENAAAAVAVQKIFSISAMFIVIAAIGSFFPLPPDGGGILAAGRLVFLPFLFLFAAIFAAPGKIENLLRTRKEPRFSWMRRFRDFLLAVCGQVKNLRGNKKSAAVFALSLAIWLIYPVKMIILVRLFAPGAEILLVASATFAAYLVAMLPIFPGGLGGFEGTLMGLLAAGGVALTDAAVVTITFRFVTFWFVMLASAAYVALRKLLRPSI